MKTCYFEDLFALILTNGIIEIQYCITCLFVGFCYSPITKQVFNNIRTEGSYMFSRYFCRESNLVWDVENYLPKLIRTCYLSCGRSIAHKCSRLLMMCARYFTVRTSLYTVDPSVLKLWFPSLQYTN